MWKLSKAQKDDIVEMYNTGMTNCRQLGEMYGVTHEAIRCILKRRGIIIDRHRKRVNTGGPNLSTNSEVIMLKRRRS